MKNSNRVLKIVMMPVVAAALLITSLSATADAAYEQRKCQIEKERCINSIPQPAGICAFKCPQLKDGCVINYNNCLNEIKK